MSIGIRQLMMNFNPIPYSVWHTPVLPPQRKRSLADAVSAMKSFIVPSATMTIHPVRMNGLVLGVPQTLSYFDKMQDRIVNFVTANSGISEDDFRSLMMKTGELVMDVGTVVDGAKAVEIGLIDSLGGLSDAIECLYDLIEQSGEKYPDNEENGEDEK